MEVRLAGLEPAIFGFVVQRLSNLAIVPMTVVEEK